MRIATSELALAASHQKTTVHVRQERLEIWGPTRRGEAADADGSRLDADRLRQRTRPRPPVFAEGEPPHGKRALGVRLEADARGRAGRRGEGHGPDAEGEGEGKGPAEYLVDRDRLDLELILRTLERKAKPGHHGDRQASDDKRVFDKALALVQAIKDAYAHTPDPIDLPVAEGSATQAAPAAEQGWGFAYDLVEQRTEIETSRFEAHGRVTTADGRSIDFAAVLAQTRLEAESTEVHIRGGAAKLVDPLVLNLDGGPATFSGTHTFDLDADGETETLARLGVGSAYLTLDQNGNGRVDDGRELFGPTTGNGFAELAGHDADANGWIDEADPVWTDLRLWRPDSGDGPGLFTSLGAAGVGAIALASVRSPFEVQADGVTVAQVGATGVYLRESGEAGTVQHLDLVV